MRMLRAPLLLASLVSLMAAACGGATGEALNPALAGSWASSLNVTVAGHDAHGAFTATLPLAVSGYTATLGAVCPDGTGSVTLTGTGTGAKWSGHLDCPPVAIDGCARVALEYGAAWIRLGANGALEANMMGTADWCGASSGANAYFLGSR